MELRILQQTQEDRDIELARYLNISVEEIQTYPIRTTQTAKCGPTEETEITSEADIIDMYRTYKYADFNKHLRTMMFTSVNNRPASLFKLIDKSENILNFGSGCGTHTIYANEKGKFVTDLDVQGKMTAFADWRLKLRDFSKYIRVPHTFELPNNTYDAIICVDVLEHVIHPLKTLNMLIDSLQKEGKICLVVSKMIKPTSGHFSFTIKEWIDEGLKCLNKRCKHLGNDIYGKR